MVVLIFIWAIIAVFAAVAVNFDDDDDVFVCCSTLFVVCSVAMMLERALAAGITVKVELI